MQKIWVSAAELAAEWRCSLRTAQRAISRVPHPWRERRGRFYFAMRIMIKRPRGRGRPPRSH